MKLPEPVAWLYEDCGSDVLTFFQPRREAQSLFTEAQMREALASHEAVMRQAMQSLDECAGLTSRDAQRRVAAIKALEDALK